MSDHDDMISAVRASVDQLSSKEPDSVETTPEREAPEPETSAAPERARDPETGRFTAKEAEPVKEQPTTEAQEAQELAPSPAPVLKPPTSWSADAKTEWAKLSPALQQAVLKREGEISNGQQQYSDERQRLRALEGIIAPRRDYYSKYGFKSDVEAINHLFTLSDSMERDPAGTILHLARSAGVDLNRLISGGYQQQPQQQFQPQQQSQPDLSRQVEEQVAMQFAKMTVQEFEADAPEHYREVKPLMQMLLERGQASDLQDAYDKAIWMNPNIRNGLIEKQRADEAEKQRQQSATKVIQKTKAANASLNGAPHGAQSAPPPRKERGAFGEVADDVRAAISALR